MLFIYKDIMKWSLPDLAKKIFQSLIVIANHCLKLQNDITTCILNNCLLVYVCVSVFL